MTPKTATRATLREDNPGQNPVTDNKNSTTLWLSRQVIKTTLPYIAAIITSTRFTARKSLLLDRLLTTAEGGSHDI